MAPHPPKGPVPCFPQCEPYPLLTPAGWVFLQEHRTGGPGVGTDHIDGTDKPPDVSQSRPQAIPRHTGVSLVNLVPKLCRRETRSEIPKGPVPNFAKRKGERRSKDKKHAAGYRRAPIRKNR